MFFHLKVFVFCISDIPNLLSTLISNKRGGWNKRGGGAKNGKSLNVEGVININF